jgi:hypothetical protein
MNLFTAAKAVKESIININLPPDVAKDATPSGGSIFIIFCNMGKEGARS